MMQVRYDSLESCAGLGHLGPEEVLADIKPLCAPSTPLGMCYAPMPAHAAAARAAAIGGSQPLHKPRRAASPAAQPAAPAASAPAESDGRLGSRQRACKRKVKYSDTEAQLSTASGAHRSSLQLTQSGLILFEISSMESSTGPRLAHA